VHTWFASATEFSCVFRMADTSSYSTEECWVQVCGCMRGSTQDKPCSMWWLRSGNGLIRLHHKEQHCWIGKNERSLLEVLKTGRGVAEKQCAWKHAAGAASIERSPMKSTRKRSSELGVPRATVRDHMKKDLNVRPYRLTFVNELLHSFSN